MKWKQPVPGTQFTCGKLVTFGIKWISVDKAWPPQSWRRNALGPWTHAPTQFPVSGEKDLVLHARLDKLRATLAVTPQLIDRSGRKAKLRPLNSDGTIGTPFEDGWQSRLPWARPYEEQASDKVPSRGALRAGLANTLFQLAIPEKARRAVRHVAPMQRAKVLGLLHRGGEPAYELLASNPALAVALCNLPLFKPGLAKPWRSAVALLKKRQRRICEYLGFAGEEGIVRLLRKIPGRYLEAKHLLFLRTVLAEDPGLSKVLAHLPRFSTRELILCTVPATRDLVTPSFLNQVCLLPARDPGPYSELADTVLMGRQIHGQVWEPAPFQTLAQLRRLHDELAHLTAGLGETNYDFGPPPLPGDEVMRPLENEVALRLEANAMHNCVASYSRRVLKGHVYIYHVALPGNECTLALQKGSDGRWKLGEMKAGANARPDRSTVLQVRKWFRQRTQTLSKEGSA